MRKFIFCMMLLLWGAANAQIEKLWESYYTPTNDTLDIKGTKADASGNLYTFGSEGSNLFLQKVNAQGSIEWTITDNALIAPIPGDPYTQNNLLQWARITDVLPIYKQDTFIVITGKAKYFNFSSSLHNFTIKFSTLGDTMWSRIYTNLDLISDGRIESTSIPKILYSTNSIFLAAVTKFGDTGNQDILLSRLDMENGNILSYKNFSSKPVLGEFLENFSFKDGFFYVSGLYSIGRSFPVSHPVGGWESFLIKLDTSFNRITETFEGNPSSLNYAIRHETDENGNLHILIQSQDSLKSYQKTILFIKYNDEGNELWRFEYNDTFGSNDSALLFNLDGYGNIRIIAQTTNHNRSLFFLLDSDGNVKSSHKEDSNSFFIQPPTHLTPACNGCPRMKTASTFPTINVKNSTYYFNLKNHTVGISKISNNMQHWWDTDTILVPGYAPLNIVFTDTFEFNTTALIDTLTEKKIRYIKYRDTSWLKAPFSLTATAFSLHNIRLEWKALPDYKTGFVIERSSDGLVFTAVDTISMDSLAFTDSGLSKNTLYYYQVKTINQYGTSVPSVIDVDTTFDNVGIKNTLPENTSIYPNPFNNMLYVELPDAGGVFELVLYDLHGKEIVRQKSNERLSGIQTNDLKKGLYLLKITNLTHNLSSSYKVLKL